MSLLARAHVQPDLVAGPGPGSSGQQDWPFNINVLVVDDDPLCLKIVEHQLRRCAQHSVGDLSPRPAASCHHIAIPR